MAVDGFARALAFAAAKAEDISGLQADVAEVQASLETTKQEINTTLENTTNELNETLEATKSEVNAELDATTEELRKEIEALNKDFEEKRVKIFDSNIVTYELIDPEIRRNFDIAIAVPGVELTESQLDSINTMVGEAGTTIVNMSAQELNNKLDAIIGGE